VRVPRADLVDLTETVRGAARLATAHPDVREGVCIDCVVPEGAPIVVTGDEDMLHRALFNLLLNAVQASPPQSKVTVEILTDVGDAAAVHGQFEAGSMGIRVSDHGSGIPDEVRSRLFDPFTTTKPQGTGLGLAVVHRAIVAHKGLVLVDSGSDGTRVTIVLPNTMVATPALT
jgi:two-component system sensor histidine kinase PilS (NtrC family)